MSKQFKLSAADKKLAGVCGGIAEYLNIDPLLVRIGWVALTLCGGCGLLLYLLLWLLAPKA
ncbi:MAG: PspC domain-containing protein [Bacteroidaceae bacterium]|nr:PspC domain-containing protein [Bacteroidaceae bacterium]